MSERSPFFKVKPVIELYAKPGDVIRPLVKFFVTVPQSDAVFVPAPEGYGLTNFQGSVRSLLARFFPDRKIHSRQDKYQDSGGVWFWWEPDPLYQKRILNVINGPKAARAGVTDVPAADVEVQA